MSFILKIYDRKGVELKEGDIVAISNADRFNFYAEVKYLPEEKSVAPFHTFAFHSFEKVDSVPEKATLSSETRYKIWYVAVDGEELTDTGAKDHDHYLMSWRECEYMINQRVFQIEPIVGPRILPPSEEKQKVETELTLFPL